MSQGPFTQQVVPISANLDEAQRTRAAALLVAKDVVGTANTKRLVFLASFITGGFGAYVTTRRLISDLGKDAPNTMPPALTWESATIDGERLVGMFEGIPDDTP